jgi:hypothetical protein
MHITWPGRHPHTRGTVGLARQGDREAERDRGRAGGLHGAAQVGEHTPHTELPAARIRAALDAGHGIAVLPLMELADPADAVGAENHVRGLTLRRRATSGALMSCSNSSAACIRTVSRR